MNEFIELGNDLHDQPFYEINHEKKHPFDFEQQGEIVHQFYDPIDEVMELAF